MTVYSATLAWDKISLRKLDDPVNREGWEGLQAGRKELRGIPECGSPGLNASRFDLVMC